VNAILSRLKPSHFTQNAGFSMSAINGDKGRFNRQRRQKLARRIHSQVESIERQILFLFYFLWVGEGASTPTPVGWLCPGQLSGSLRWKAIGFPVSPLDSNPKCLAGCIL
jgi:hypothetical protein